MIQTQNFAVRPNGIIRAGNATYKVDTDSGEITYSGELNLKWPMKDKIIGPASYTVDPTLLESAHLLQQGDAITVGDATFSVSTVGPGKTIDAAMSILGQPVSGFVNLDVGGKYFLINAITATVKVPIIGTILVQADPVASLTAYPRLWKRIVSAIRKFFKR